MNQIAFAKIPTPVFNTPAIAAQFGGATGDCIPLDAQGLLRSVETILFPGARLQLVSSVGGSNIWKIKTAEYDYPQDLYIDGRFVSNEGSDNQRSLPSPSEILDTLCRLENTRYIWGGNWPSGVELLRKLYPSKSPFHQLDPLVQDTWQLKGVDCSGLLHYATNGYTPRNTSSLIHFGRPVAIEAKSISAIVDELQPLDIIAWPGHVVCAIDKETTVESLALQGVVKRSSYERLSQIAEERRAVNAWEASSDPRFVIRRWYPA